MSYFIDRYGELREQFDYPESNEITVVFEAYIPTHVMNEMWADIPYLIEFLKNIGKDVDQ